MSCWDWITQQMAQTKQEERVALKEKCHEATAYRRNIQRLIDENMAAYAELDKEFNRASHIEDALRDELGNMPR